MQQHKRENLASRPSEKEELSTQCVIGSLALYILIKSSYAL